VCQLWRYPVKSMQGERCEFLDLDPRGVTGDRAYAIRDIEGKFGSGKNTRRFRKIDGLFGFRAAYDGAVPAVYFPNGNFMRGDDPTIHVALSNELGQPVTLVLESDVPHFDAAPIHILTTASLAWLKSALPDSIVDERRFRPNLVVETPDDAPREHTWVDKFIHIGGEVKLRVVDRTERCRMVALAQSELPDDLAILGHITECADLEFGAYAEIVSPGTIRRGDVATLGG
jgi:uncharacterized protein